MAGTSASRKNGSSNWQVFILIIVDILAVVWGETIEKKSSRLIIGKFTWFEELKHIDT
jgi:hypothetical protein